MTIPFRSRRHEARAVNSRNLSWASSHVSDIDVLAARGISGSSLGADLERLKYGFDRGAYQSCFEQLTEKFHRRIRHRVSSSFVHTALHEFLDDRCTICGGRASVQIDIYESACCDTCNGTGQRRYTDAERAHACSVKISAWSYHERDYLELIGCIHSAIGAHQRGMAQALADNV